MTRNEALLYFVDVEAYGAVPALGAMTEFGIVVYPYRMTFHGELVKSVPDPKNPAVPVPVEKVTKEKELEVAKKAEKFIYSFIPKAGRAILVSDNPAFDFMWTADFFWRTLGYNPFGHSGRRIADFYAGLVGDWSDSQSWKSHRITPHDHNPVNDAMGNLEAFEWMLNLPHVVQDLSGVRRK